MTGSSSTASTGAVPLVGKKYMAKLGSMVNESAASEMSLFARKQMEKMGWSEGKGLGKSEQGVSTYVRVKKREESMGIGVEAQKAEEQQNQWWYNAYDKLADKIKISMDSDEETAANTKSKKKSKKKAKKKASKKRARGSDSDDSSSSDEEKSSPSAEAAGNKKFRVPTDEELFAATGGKLFGRRAYGSCNGKLKRDALLIKGDLKLVQAMTNASTTSDKESKQTRKEEAGSSTNGDNDADDASSPSSSSSEKKKSKKKSKKDSKKKQKKSD